MRGGWASMIMMSPDGRPIIDRIPSVEGLWMMLGDSGTSFKTSPATGRCLAWRVLLYAIVPQVRPVFAGVAIYRWDINIRESTVLGLVGAGGIGFALNEAILGLEWRRVGLILLVVLGVVVVSETASAFLRKRVT